MHSSVLSELEHMNRAQRHISTQTVFYTGDSIVNLVSKERPRTRSESCSEHILEFVVFLNDSPFMFRGLEALDTTPWSQRAAIEAILARPSALGGIIRDRGKGRPKS